MKVGLIDIDGHNFPNLPLMKLSAWHKQKGDTVEMIDLPLLATEYDRVYMSKVFTSTPDYNYHIRASEIIKGGTGYGLDNKLDDEIENIYPDYDLYGIKDTAYGFLTRGCPRACKFCIVAEKEGRKSIKVADLKQFWRGQKYIKLLDPNLLACKERIELLKDLIESKAYIDFTQGLDIRMMSSEIASMLNQLKVKMIHFAWDNYEFETYEKLKEYRSQLDYGFRKLRVYVLTNFNTIIDQDLERIYKLKELGYDPFVMVYERETASRELKKIQRWVNNKFVFRSCNRFEDYKVG